MPQQMLEAVSINERLAELHREILLDFPGVARLAVALHDPQTDRLRTFAHSTLGEPPIAHYERALSGMPCLAAMAKSGESRVIDDLRAWPGCEQEHTRRLLAKGYRSSLTSPLIEGRTFLGFLFYDSPKVGHFTADTVRRLRPYTRLAASLVASVLDRVKLLAAAVRATRRIARLRDEETGAHLERMSRYTLLIAQGVAGRHDLDDEYVAFLTLFAPLHDIGKIGVPDRVLLKPGPLDPDELELMRSHVEFGRAIVDMLGEEFDLATLPHVEILRSVVLHHHEASDGSGYPLRLVGDDIPLEARIVRVADVFDALTSERPYKQAWTDDEAFAFLQERSRHAFDAECVAALAARRAEIDEIRRRFADCTAAANSHEGYAPDI